ncbi:MAG: sulfatase-like hydrolase/transferase [Prevotellaceae bacterium]|jgi:arylsulfatase A-like enzyme|nr:sulfatase-like hydrolase/transferase [Prevotellaceae bacterium]
MKRLFQLSTLATGTSILLSGCADATGNSQAQPNIIFILADDLGSADVGAYGSEYIQTPNIDRLASEGLSFTQAYAGASVSSPARCTFLTGLHAGHGRIRSNFARQGAIEGRKGNAVIHRPNLLPQDSTIANVLSNNGYHTILVNKWHVDGFDTAAHPLNRGFQEFYGWLVPEHRSHNHYPEIRYRNREQYAIDENLDGKRALHCTDIATDEAIDFIKREKNKPFFLFLTYNAPHTPLHAKSLDAYKDVDLPEKDKAYAALVTHLDAAIGRVLSEVKFAGIEDETVIIFASDNGGSTEAQLEKIRQNGALRGYKGQLYEGGLRVPLIIKTGDKKIAGKKSDFPTYFPDLFATLVDLSGAHTSLKTDGVSLLPEFKSPNSLDASQRSLYWEQYPRQGIAQAARRGEWKLIKHSVQAEYELYNLKTDPSETTNVALQYPDVVSALATELKNAHTESDWWPVSEKIIY